ncbi:uncharacterized protein BDW70DRAFT_163954 [Aspergillus foveolatus]|uniref:uncharacterized protein n=1 Tax=Aspergillus foveolatus TaxID=210207 RepID=UPI003CCC9FDF
MSIVEQRGYYLPRVLSGTVISSIAYGLLSMLSPSTSSYIAIQNLVPAPVAMAIMIFCQNLGGTVFRIAAQTIFSNILLDGITKHVPGVNATLIIAAGARSILELVSGEQLARVLDAYSTAIDRIMYLDVGISVAAFAFAWRLGWKDIRVNKKNNQPIEEGDEGAKV